MHHVVNVTEEQAAAAIEGLDPDKVPWVVVYILVELRHVQQVTLAACSTSCTLPGFS